ncbi:MAG: tyrosine-type recombinase/integrase, partial [Chloroflexi bacterium]|nr:tyrosine-type recombinase/integrase [Chloroflexota bacterium]
RDPAEAVIHRSVTAPLPEILSDEAVEQVLAVTEAMRHGEHPDARPHLLFTLLLHTGIKKSEAVSIVLNHIDVIDPMHPVLWIRYANPRRRHKERKLALPEWWPTVLAEYQAQYRIHDALFPWTARNLEYVLRDIAEAADLGRGLSFEMIRWTCAVRDHRAGMSDTALRQKLGISKITWREVRLKVVQMADRGH